MSVETITIIIAAASLAATIVGGLFGVAAWILRHTAQQMEAQFAKVDEQFKEMGTQMSGMREGLSDVKVAVARLEGPPQRLIFPPH